eukprot:jgi/Chlat1/783/Chrsp104S01252
MFIVSQLSDNLRILPHNLAKPTAQAVTEELERLYIDKVVSDLGLCVTLYEIDSIEGGYVYPSDGAAHFTVTFKLVFFRPFIGEVLLGKLIKCDETGLIVSLGFFEDIFIPEHLLQEPSTYDIDEKLWVWKFDGNDMFMDLEEQVRFRVNSVRYPSLPAEGDDGQLEVGAVFAPMEIAGDINADGLGLTTWWS